LSRASVVLCVSIGCKVEGAWLITGRPTRMRISDVDQPASRASAAAATNNNLIMVLTSGPPLCIRKAVLGSMRDQLAGQSIIPPRLLGWD
jgi:hypothetical protein